MARRVFRRKKDGIHVRLDADEAAAMRSWFDQLEILIEEPGVLGHEVARRLSPVAYPDDPLAEDEYQQLSTIFMTEERRASLEVVRSILTRGARDNGRVHAVMSEEEAEQWLMSTNHLRLAIGTALGVEQDVDPAVPPRDPAFPLYAGYLQLSILLEDLLAELDPGSIVGEAALD